MNKTIDARRGVCIEVCVKECIYSVYTADIKKQCKNNAKTIQTAHIAQIRAKTMFHEAYFTIYREFYIALNISV